MSNNKTITLNWNIPISMVISIVLLAVYGTMGYARIMAKLDGDVSQRQMRIWIEDARERNPGVKFPPFPERKDTGKELEPVAYFSRVEYKPTKN